MILAETRSELTRLNRRGIVIGWLGITVLLAFMITTFIFVAAGDGTDVPSAAPGGSFPSAADLAAPDGRVLGLSAVSTILGVVTLSFWAVAVSTDYTTGLIRLLVQAQPHRLRLLAGKILALAGWTALSTSIATLIVAAASPVMASGAGVSTAAWKTGASGIATQVTGAWLNIFLALLVWGVVGLVIAALTKSSATAIGVGLGYVLVVEGLLRLAAPDAADWLPGATLTAIAGGGSTAIPYGTALGLGLAYAVVGLSPTDRPRVGNPAVPSAAAHHRRTELNARGERTRTRLIRATVDVVAEVGYARATTKAIADAAGVAEGTIYRHYPDKRHLFFAAVFDRNAAVLEWVSGLPARAGTGTVRGNLEDALMKLGQLRADLMPLELWLRSDPELAGGLAAAFAGLTASAVDPVATDRPVSALPGPPQFIAGYIAAEQALGRLRPTVDPDDVAVLLLVVLFGIAMMPAGDGHTVDGRLVAVAVSTIMDGIGAGTGTGTGTGD